MIGILLPDFGRGFAPSSTSCSGVYLFFGGLTSVCASRPTAVMHRTTNSAQARFAAVEHSIVGALAMIAPPDGAAEPRTRRSRHSLARAPDSLLRRTLRE